jgi:hypothetical protein
VCLCWGAKTLANSSSRNRPMPAITSFTANPTSVHSGTGSGLSWATTGATRRTYPLKPPYINPIS